MISINQQISIQGKTCILVRDVLGGAPSDKYTYLNQGNYKVWYEEQALRETREANPDVPVYGFWQTMIASGLLDTKKTLQYIYTSEARDYGYYLYSSDNVIHTGALFQGELQRLPGKAIQDRITLDDGEEIAVDIDTLKLPNQTLQTHKERVQFAAKQKKQARQQGFLIASLTMGVALLADTGLVFHHEQHMQDYNTAMTELSAAGERLDAVNRLKLIDWPSQTLPLSNLYQVGTTLAESNVTGEVSLLASQSPSLEATGTQNVSGKIAILESYGMQVNQAQANKMVISWSNDELQ